MDRDAIISLAAEEIELSTFGTTEQFLEIHKVALENGRPKVIHVEIDAIQNDAAVYFAVQGERFYFTVWLKIFPDPIVRGTDPMPYHNVYFFAGSETISSSDLISSTKLLNLNDNAERPITGSFSLQKDGFSFVPDKIPGFFEDKLDRLLDFLEQDSVGVKYLSTVADTCINVDSIFHNGNTCLGGHHLDKRQIARLAALGLSIDFDCYAEGNLYK